MCDKEEQNEEESESESELEELNDIQLGFLQNSANILFLQADWSKWDGGKVGGKPIWLNPSGVPDATNLQCRGCGDVCVFLLQIYCPLDQYTTTAFHRCLYVFCCKKASCCEKGNIQCLRTQLAKRNNYYLENPENPTGTSCPYPELKLCVVCGLKGSFSCSACAGTAHKTQYCSKNHQQYDWKYHKQVCGGKATTSSEVPDRTKTLTFPEYEICIEEEVLGEKTKVQHECFDNKQDKDHIENALKSSNFSENTVVWEDAVTEGGEDEKADADLKQEDYRKALGNEASDPVYSKFLSRVRRGGDKQVLRYFCGPRTEEDRLERSEQGQESTTDDMPLSISSAGNLDRRDIPSCEHCHSPRVFEFQIMPQLLHYLSVDKSTEVNKFRCAYTADDKGAPSPNLKDLFVNSNNEDMDWGSVDVYTCAKSCTPPDDTPYVSEFCWRQPPPEALSAS